MHLLRLHRKVPESTWKHWRRSFQVDTGIKPKSWYTRVGYGVADIPKVVYHIEEKALNSRKKLRSDPFRAAGIATMACKDLNDAIPFLAAARLLGYEDPDFKYSGFLTNADPLPFKVHPRLHLYPWISTPMAKRSDIEEIIDSGNYPGALKDGR